MLLSEFIERTGANVSGETYTEIERVYNEVSVDKDVFCAGWKKYQKDEFVSDLMVTIISLSIKYENECGIADQLEAEIERMKTAHKKETEDLYISLLNSNKDFAKKILRQASNESINNILNVIEEEFGYGFIIKSKREMGITLTEQEIDYLVSKI